MLMEVRKTTSLFTYCPKWTMNVHKIRTFSSVRRKSVHLNLNGPISKNIRYKTSVSFTSTTEPYETTTKTDSETNLSDSLIAHLERTSLVDFEDDKALQQLREAINFASTLEEIDTEGVEPMTSPLDPLDGETAPPLYLRSDKAELTSRKEILDNAKVTEEDYFVAPPGNIPLNSTPSS